MINLFSYFSNFKTLSLNFNYFYFVRNYSFYECEGLKNINTKTYLDTKTYLEYIYASFGYATTYLEYI